MNDSSGEIRVLDLFCGMGGLALGFARNGFLVTGYDIYPRVPEIFEINQIGQAIVADLRTKGIRPEDRAATLIIGGPPCRPWSALNVRQRGSRHPDHDLFRIFLEIVGEIRPEAFLMENVPRLERDPAFHECLQLIEPGYDLAWKVVCYADYGAAIARHRLFLAGFRRSESTNRALTFFECLEAFRKPPRTVRDALETLEKSGTGDDPEHVWFNFQTVEKYQGKYRTGKYGWYQLSPDRPAPSFGNISKTYILHPFAGNGYGVPLRVLSVREAMTIMGFPLAFRFPPGTSLTDRYQMVADAVSPVFSEICAQVMLKILGQ
ncbi:DNA cytosine methyltransferase [uncultured Thermanaerothrix sp.]|uniref:DNA cytosine methyltransferase n=1 Tax=uncultured Thermanaerothrix sp. TaxID=1195149 RepID=UPI0026327F0B|nr:DNA cytosine methyltransferase [uncultured Thermanaerothrix sp.]